MRKKGLVGILWALALAAAPGLCAQAETVTYDDGSQYEGNLVDGKKEGFGIKTNKNGNRWEGIWHNDLRQGPCTFFYTDGRRFDGFCEDERLEGFGVFTNPNIENYKIINTYHDGECNGLRIAFDQDGGVEATIYEAGEPSDTELVSWTDAGATYYAENKTDINGGKAIIVYSDNPSGGVCDVYMGELADGKPEGKGVMCWSDGRWLMGSWSDGHIEGEGLFYYAPQDSTEVHGRYLKSTWHDEDDRMEGLAVIYMSDGSRMIGVCEDDEYQGYGAFVASDGSITPQEWERGKVVDNFDVWKKGDAAWKQVREGDGSNKNGTADYGICIYESGEIYIGDLEGEQREGKGVYYWPETEESYEGEFKAWKMDGTGKAYFIRNGRYGYYVGDCEAGMRQGEGVLYLGDGSWYEGTWKNDSFDSGVCAEIKEDGSLGITLYENAQAKENGAGVTVYRDSNYYGVCAVLEPGEYRAADLRKRGVYAHSISSLEVPDGYHVTVYQNDDLSGDSCEYTEDTELAGTVWNNRTASIAVQKDEAGGTERGK